MKKEILFGDELSIEGKLHILKRHTNMVNNIFFILSVMVALMNISAYKKHFPYLLTNSFLF